MIRHTTENNLKGLFFVVFSVIGQSQAFSGRKLNCYCVRIGKKWLLFAVRKGGYSSHLTAVHMRTRRADALQSRTAC